MAKTNKSSTEDGGELGSRSESYNATIRKKTGQMASLSFTGHPELQELDTDGDGQIDEDDLLRLLKLKHKEENIIREQRYGLIFLSLIILGVGLGLGLELKTSKEATADAIEYARLGATQAHEVEVPPEMKVDGSAPSIFQPSTTDPIKQAPSVDLTDKEGNPIRSDRSLDKVKLTSELPDATFAELTRIQIEGVAGIINFRTQGFGRYNAPDSRCGSIVVVYTTMGSVQFDGTAMLFDEQVAGSFQNAGFRVSGARTRPGRTSTGRSRRKAEMDENNYSLIGVNRMFGEFAFIANVDLSSLSCGDERPSVKSPFDGDVWDVQTEEDELFVCGKGGSECPTTAPLIEGLNGETYFKRTTKMRAKKVDGVWRTIRATTFPDLNNDPATPEQYRDGQYVEISNGVRGQVYQYWPNDHPERSPPVFTHCEHNATTFDRSGAIEANSTDVPDMAYAIDFIGYDILNNHYVKHFRVYDLNPGDSDLTDVDYLESYDEDRMYSVQLLKGHWATYESIKTNGDVDPNFLQGAGYPDIDAADFGDGASDPVPCADVILWDAIKEGFEYKYEEILAFQQERDHAAERPDLGQYVSGVWDPAKFKGGVARQLEAGKYLINTLFPGWKDNPHAAYDDDHDGQGPLPPRAHDTAPAVGSGDNDKNRTRRSHPENDVPYDKCDGPQYKFHSLTNRQRLSRRANSTDVPEDGGGDDESRSRRGHQTLATCTDSSCIACRLPGNTCGCMDPAFMEYSPDVTHKCPAPNTIGGEDCASPRCSVNAPFKSTWKFGEWTLTTSSTYNKWCTDTIPAAVPTSIGAGGLATFRSCIEQCYNMDDCAWVGSSAKGGECSFWKEGSCKEQYVDSCTDITRVDDSAFSAAVQKANDLEEVADTSTYRNIDETPCTGRSDFPMIINENDCIGAGMVTEMTRPMGDNPRMTIRVTTCADPVYAGFEMKMEGSMTVLEYWLLEGTGTIIGTVGYIDDMEGKKRLMFKFEGKAELTFKGVDVSNGYMGTSIRLQVSASYMYSFGAARPHTIMIGGTIEVKGCLGQNRRKRRRGYAAELEGVLRRDPRGFGFFVAVEEFFSDAGDAIVDVVDAVGDVLDEFGHTVAEAAAKVAEALRQTELCASLAVTLTNIYNENTFTQLKAVFPKHPTSVRLDITAKFLTWQTKLTIPLRKAPGEAPIDNFGGTGFTTGNKNVGTCLGAHR